MPTYEYRCDACGHQFEEFQKISDLPINRCPKCKKKKARRQISQGNFILKGGGWYVTDYKTGGGRKGGKDRDRDESASSTKSDEKKSDDKRSDDKRSDDKRSDDKKSDDKRSDDRKSDDKKSDGKKSDDKKSDGKRSEAKDDRPAKKAAEK